MSNSWPCLKRYSGRHLRRVALPLGGIGTGTVSLGGRGDLRDWEVMNRPAKGYSHNHAFFALSVDGSQGNVRRALEGPIDPADFEGGFGVVLPNHGLPRFRECRFDAAYPLAEIHLSDPGVPVSVRLRAFNPLVPADADASGIPVAVLRYTVENLTDEALTVAVCGSVPNFIGHDGESGECKGNVNEKAQGPGFQGVFMRSDGVDRQSAQWGTMALAVLDCGETTVRTAWAQRTWGDSLLDFWDDLADGRLEPRDQGTETKPAASVCQRCTIPPRGSCDYVFLLGWHFPNRLVWHPKGEADEVVGNFYTTRYSDAWDVLLQTAPALPDLESRTVAFVRSFCEADLPDPVKEAALFNLSTLRSQTSFRTPDGHFFGWEGCGDHTGCCEGSCTHVWNYEQATAFLFGDLARRMRKVEFLHATRDSGLMSFRVGLPLGRAAQNWDLAAADGQMGCVMKLYRDWRLCGDLEFLRALWPKVKSALEFAWQPSGWDGDQDGVMEGCQHNTMDVEYYGPNPQMQGWYLGALRSAEEMARAVGDTEFADICRGRFEHGSRWADEHLFNGAYYEHLVQPAGSEDKIGAGLRHDGMGAKDLKNPELQLAAGCLIDQLVGQYMAHICGLGYLLDRGHIHTTLRTLMRRNFRPDMWAHFNHLRTFALEGESAMVMAWYPEDRRPERPFPYCNEVMTGFEYTAAAHMMQEGMVEEGLKVVEAIRDRYDGERRSPFDEAECGHHYARAMASWACVLALSGFDYDGRSGALRFGVIPDGHAFWSTGDAFGTFKVVDGTATVEAIEGELRVVSLLVGSLKAAVSAETVVKAAQPLRARLV